MAKPRETLKVLLTAGPTRAYLDRVRFLSNFSTGELGFLTAEILKRKGVEILAVVGPCSHPFEKLKLKKLVRVETNDEMEAAIFKILQTEKIKWGIFSAAILDFKPQRVGKGKTSSRTGAWQIKLIPTHKIIDRVAVRYPHIKKVGFKLEWTPKKGSGLNKFGQEQLRKRDYEALVLNFLPEVKSKKQHKAYLFRRGDGQPLVAKSKPEIAEWISEQVRGAREDQ